MLATLWQSFKKIIIAILPIVKEMYICQETLTRSGKMQTATVKIELDETR